MNPATPANPPNVPPPRSVPRRWWRHLTQAVALYLVLAGLHAGRALLTGDLAPSENFVNMPNCAFSWRCAREGALPLWNPYLYGGLPHLASNHAGALYPPVYFFFALFNPFRAFGLMIALHYFWAGLGTWTLLRGGWRLRQGAALAGGAFFMLSGFAVAHELHAPMLMALAWIPWLLWLSRRTLAGGRWAGPALAAAIALQIAAGYMQTAAQTLIVMGAEALVIALWPRRRGSVVRLGRWGLAVGTGLGLMAVQLLATVEILPMTFRTEVSFANFTSHGYAWGQLPELFFPLLFGAEQPFLLVKQLFFIPLAQSELTMSMGAAAWVGVLLWVFGKKSGRGRPRSQEWFWAGVCVFCVLALVGKDSPLNRLLYHLPVLNMFRVQNRWMVFMNLGISILAAAGLSNLIDSIRVEARTPNSIWPLLAGLILLTLAYPAACIWLGLFPNLPIDKSEYWLVIKWLKLSNPAIWLPLAFGAAALAVLALVWRRPRAWRVAVGLWIGLYALEQGILTAQVVLRLSWPAAWHTSPGNEAADWMLRRHGGRAEDFRILTPTGEHVQLSEETMPFMLPQLNGIYSAGGYWPLQNPLQARLTRIDNIGDTLDLKGLLEHPAILDLLNVRYLAVGHWFDGWMPEAWRPDLPATPLAQLLESGRYPWLKPVHRTARGVTIFENTRALPRAWCVTRLEPARGPEEAIDRLWREPEFDPARRALVTWTDGRPWDAAGEATSATARITRRASDRIWLEVDAPRGPAFVVLSEVWYPGWWARVDGRLAPIHVADGILRGIETPAGRHEIYLRYLPPGFRRGLFISVAFAGLWGLWMILETVGHFRRKRSCGKI